MKPEQLLLLVALAIIFWPATQVVETDVYDLMANEGMVAVQANLDNSVTIKPEPDPQSDCKCDGTGYIISPDGIKRIKCPCGDNCSCTKTDVEKRVCPQCGREDCPSFLSGDIHKEEFLDRSLDRQVLFLTGPWCQWCYTWLTNEKPKLESKNWKISEDRKSDIRIVDIEKHPEIYREFGGNNGLPTFIKLEKGKMTKRLIGYHTAIEIANLYLGK